MTNLLKYMFVGSLAALGASILLLVIVGLGVVLFKLIGPVFTSVAIVACVGAVIGMMFYSFEQFK